MRKIALISALFFGAMVLTSGIAMAATYDDHVAVAPNGVGDALIYPVYVAFPGGWGTKIIAYNTSTTHSVVAKVVVRGGKYTQELLDFFIYLTPADVWTGSFTVEGGQVTFTSSDDSVRIAQSTFATPANPFKVNLDSQNQTHVGNCDWTQIGYVEIFEAWATPTPRPYKKTTLLTQFERQVAIDPDENILDVLAGQYEIYNNTLGLLAANEATVLQNLNTNQKLELGRETFFGSQWSANTLCEVEAALAKDQLALHYYNGAEGKYSFNIVTFPTKLSLININTCKFGNPFARSVFYREIASAKVDFGFEYFNMQERKGQSTLPIISPQTAPTHDFPWEVNFHTPYDDDDQWTATPASAFQEGWAEYIFGYTTGDGSVACETYQGQDLRFTGAPAIAQTVKFTAALDSLAIVPGAYYTGAVSGDLDGQMTEILCYQYCPDCACWTP